MSQEEYIVGQCIKGNRDAQKLLYETYAGWLLGVCLRYVGQRSTAEDLLHDGFVQILTNIDHFQWRGEGSLKSWMLKLQHSVIMKHIRNDAKQSILILADDSSQPLEEIPNPENVGGIPGKILMQLIGELPIGYRTVFNMHVIDGLSHRDIAETLGIKEKSSASQLMRARRMLAIKINAWRKENL